MKRAVSEKLSLIWRKVSLNLQRPVCIHDQHTLADYGVSGQSRKPTSPIPEGACVNTELVHPCLTAQGLHTCGNVGFPHRLPEPRTP